MPLESVIHAMLWIWDQSYMLDELFRIRNNGLGSMPIHSAGLAVPESLDPERNVGRRRNIPPQDGGGGAWVCQVWCFSYHIDLSNRESDPWTFRFFLCQTGADQI